MTCKNELRTRYAPVLLLRGGALTKTKNFKGDKYLGDPINTILTYNEKSVDELILLDISASSSNQELNFELLSKCAQSANMPVCYGGAVRNIDVALKLVNFGIEKISLNTIIFDERGFVSHLSEIIGAQSVAVCLDVSQVDCGNYHVFSHRNSIDRGKLDQQMIQLEKETFGEFIIQNIDREGTQSGLDEQLIEFVLSRTSKPVTFIGGSACKKDILKIGKAHTGICLGVGSAFIFSGKNNAVLPNYISRKSLRSQIKVNS